MKRRLLTRLKAWERGQVIDDCRDFHHDEDDVCILYNRNQITVLKNTHSFRPFTIVYNHVPSGGYSEWTADTVEDVANIIKENFGK